MAPIQKAVDWMNLSGFTDALKAPVQSLLKEIMRAFGHIQVSVDAGGGLVLYLFSGGAQILKGQFAVLLNSLNCYQPTTIADFVNNMGNLNIGQFTIGPIVWNTGSTVP